MEMVRLRVRRDIGELESEAPSITGGMISRAGVEFEIDKKRWEIDKDNECRLFFAFGYSWMRKWLEEVDNVLDEGEEL